MTIREHHLPVRRTARYYTLGAEAGAAREVWFVCHGYGQLAARFLRHFKSLDDGRRLIVAPEGLSRHYVERRPEPRVGASWMTREDRLHEIEDYVAYLDTLHTALVTQGAKPVRTVALGFSQGVATTCRWAARGATPLTDLILWGELPPPDLDLDAAGPAYQRLKLRLVIGRNDEFVTPDRLAVSEARLRRGGVPVTTRLFEGGHEIEAAALAAVAAEVSAS